MAGYRLRLRFSKDGKAKYISHLDLMATLRRSLIRAGVKLKYSEGFNPHPYMSVALPLPVGCSSGCELVDIGTEHSLAPDGLAEIISAAAPDGIEVLEAYEPLRKFSGIAWVGIGGTLHYDSKPPHAVKRLSERFSQEHIVISKKTKSGISEIDIAPLIKNVYYSDAETDSGAGADSDADTDTDTDTCAGAGAVTVTALLSAQNPSITPGNMLSALTGDYEELKPDFAAFGRTEVYDADFRIFR